MIKIYSLVLHTIDIAIIFYWRITYNIVLVSGKSFMIWYLYTYVMVTKVKIYKTNLYLHCYNF